MKKIFVGKNDSVAEVVEKVISEPETEIVLVIPKNTLLQESVSNFHLLKREADAAGKLLTAESVDEDVLSLAKASRIEAVHPLFKKKKGSPLSDIVPKKEDGEFEDYFKKPTRTVLKKRTAEKEVIESAPEDYSEGIQKDENEEDVTFSAADKKSSRPKLFSKKLIFIGILVIAAVSTLLVWNYNREATISISFNSKPYNYTGPFTASVLSSEIDKVSNIIPAEIFTQSKNYTELFPASGRSNVSEKAVGKLIVYNAYSSQKQILVANTRFETPDGKIFRLQNEIIVPGAEIKDGKIIPSSIETSVIADKAGPSYNLGAIEKLTIPGFKDPAKFKGFYGSLVSSSGGFIGEKAVPTEKDITDAKKKIEETLKLSLGKSLEIEKPQGFKILEGATEIAVTKTSVNRSTNDKGEFSVFAEGEFRAIGFKEEDLKKLLISKSEDSESLVFKTITLNYTDAQKNFAKKELKFNLEANGVLTENFNPEAFIEKLLGRKVDEAESEIRNLKGLSTAKISISPSWLKNLPNKVEKIKIEVK